MLFRAPEAGNIPRHPSQLYELALEGLLLFAILWWFSSKPRARGQVSAVFLVGYGVFRFVAEFVREPDTVYGYLPLGLSMGQWLSLPMAIAGVWLFVWARRRACG
jgi:phosphatidylglycerol:prolipoprotein diacylglycerol transferase